MEIQKLNLFNNSNYKLIISAVSFIIVYLLIFDPKIAFIGDNAIYYLLGKALAEGKGFVNLNDPNLSPHNFYPPGYPLFIATLNKILSNSILLIKVGNGVLMFASLIVCYKLMQGMVSARIALFIAIVLALNSHMLLYSTLVMSEMMFILFSLLAIYFSSKMDWHKPSIKLFIATIMLISVSYYVRSSGLVIIMWFAYVIAINRKWKYLGFYAIAITLLIGPLYLMKSNSGYVGQALMMNPYQPELGTIGFADFFLRIWANLQRYLTYEIPNALFPIIKVDYSLTPSILNWASGILTLSIIIAGFIRVKKYGIYILLTFGLLFSWPQVWVGPRFLLPLLPFVILYFLEGLEFIFQKYKLSKGSIVAFFIIIIIQLFPVYKLHQKSQSDYPRSTANYLAIAEWLKPQKKVNVACSKPNVFYMFSDKYAFRYLYSTNASEVIHHLRDNDAKYVVLDMFFIS